MFMGHGKGYKENILNLYLFSFVDLDTLTYVTSISRMIVEGSWKDGSFME